MMRNEFLELFNDIDDSLIENSLNIGEPMQIIYPSEKRTPLRKYFAACAACVLAVFMGVLIVKSHVGHDIVLTSGDALSESNISDENIALSENDISDNNSLANLGSYSMSGIFRADLSDGSVITEARTVSAQITIALNMDPEGYLDMIPLRLFVLADGEPILFSVGGEEPALSFDIDVWLGDEEVETEISFNADENVYAMSVVAMVLPDELPPRSEKGATYMMMHEIAVNTVGQYKPPQTAELGEYNDDEPFIGYPEGLYVNLLDNGSAVVKARIDSKQGTMSCGRLFVLIDGKEFVDFDGSSSCFVDFSRGTFNYKIQDKYFADGKLHSVEAFILSADPNELDNFVFSNRLCIGGNEN